MVSTGAHGRRRLVVGILVAIGLGLVVLQVLTAPFAPLLAYILVPFLFLVAITAFFVYIYVRASR